MRPENFRNKESRRFIVARRMRWLATLALVLVLACAVDWFVLHRHHAAASMQSGNTLASAPTEPVLAAHARRSRKVIYPYSIIPGGVHSIEELKNAIAKDPVVSAQYAGFHLTNARIIRLDRERAMHVTYRRGDQVYWTQRALKLVKGETLITDGAHTALARCGNMIAEAIVAPSSPTAEATAQEPTAQELNTPVPNSYPPVELESDNRFPEIQPVGDPNEPPVGAGFHPGGGGGVEPSSFLPSGPAGPSPYPGVSTPPHPGVSTPRPVVKTPEPSTWILLLTALAALFFVQKRKTKVAAKNVS
jgi:hypothetical protein